MAAQGIPPSAHGPTPTPPPGQPASGSGAAAPEFSQAWVENMFHQLAKDGFSDAEIGQLRTAVYDAGLRGVSREELQKFAERNFGEHADAIAQIFPSDETDRALPF